MIDLHSHIIPNVDDGSTSLRCTFSLVSAAGDQGVTAMFATPHSEAFFRDAAAVYEAFDRMKAVLRDWFPQMRFFLGSEIFCQRKDMGKILELLSDGRLPSMNSTRYVLAEFSPWISREEADFCLQTLRNSGRIPILAHPERYEELDTDWVRSIREKGCKVQLNVFSLEEYADPLLRDRARALIREGQADFLGSDCHNSFVRGVSIEQGMDWLRQNVAEPYLEDLTHRNVSLLLGNGEL